MDELVFRKARVADAPEIHELINRFAGDNLMLPRPLMEIYETIRDFQVCLDSGRVAGCCALHVSWQTLGEIRSLAVNLGHQRKGGGNCLVDSCLEDAGEIGIERVFVLTYVPDFFTRKGFEPIPKDDLPHKIWADCVRCPKFPNCDEEALIRSVRRKSGND